jgi:hypothetical protein
MSSTKRRRKSQSAFKKEVEVHNGDLIHVPNPSHDQFMSNTMLPGHWQYYSGEMVGGRRGRVSSPISKSKKKQKSITHLRTPLQYFTRSQKTARRRL